MATAYPQIGRKEFLDRIATAYPPRLVEQIETAYIFAKYAHRGQYRDNGVTRFFEHVKATAWIIIDELEVVDWQIVVMALLHDTPEDAFLLSDYRIELNFGRVVATGLQLLNKNPKEGYSQRMARHATWKVLMVKLADRLHNLRTLDACTPEKRQRKYAETREEYFPLAELLVAKVPPQWREAALRLQSEIIQLCPAA